MFIRREPLANARHFAFKLAKRVARGHRLPLRLALFIFQPLQQLSESGNLAAQLRRARLLFAHGALHLAHLLEHFSQLALHGERALAALLAAGDGHVMEALARLGEEKGVWVLEGQLAAGILIGHNVAVAKLGQNYFQRLAESIEYPDAVLQRNNTVAVRKLVRGLVEDERELRLR